MCASVVFLRRMCAPVVFLRPHGARMRLEGAHLVRVRAGVRARARARARGHGLQAEPTDGLGGEVIVRRPVGEGRDDERASGLDPAAQRRQLRLAECGALGGAEHQHVERREELRAQARDGQAGMLGAARAERRGVRCERNAQGNGMSC
eukprot:scaffold33672_cov70-Phaeocystis_antarctica.AAC.2